MEDSTGPGRAVIRYCVWFREGFSRRIASRKNPCGQAHPPMIKRSRLTHRTDLRSLLAEDRVLTHASSGFFYSFFGANYQGDPLVKLAGDHI